MKKIVLSLVILIVLASCNTQPQEEVVEQEIVETPNVDKLTVLSLEEYEQFLSDKRSGIVYFGWVTNCGDSRNFQENYLEQLLSDNPELSKDFYIVDLDKEAPEALIDKTLREPLKEKYNVEFSPTLLTIKDGEQVDKIEWTLKHSDPETAIARDDLDTFFSNSGYVK